MSHGIPIQNTGNQEVCTHLTLISSDSLSLYLAWLVSPNISALPLSHYTRIYTSVGFTGDRAPISLPFSHRRSTMSKISSCPRLLLPWSPILIIMVSFFDAWRECPASHHRRPVVVEVQNDEELEIVVWPGKISYNLIFFSSTDRLSSSLQPNLFTASQQPASQWLDPNGGVLDGTRTDPRINFCLCFDSRSLWSRSSSSSLPHCRSVSSGIQPPRNYLLSRMWMAPWLRLVSPRLWHSGSSI